jgi:hypothetical protein
MKPRPTRHGAAGDDARRVARLRWSLLAILSVASVLVGAAAIFERTPARVALTLTASEVAYTLASPWSLHDLHAAGVRLSGIAPMRMEVTSVALAQRNRLTDAVTGWRQLALRGAITVQPQPGTTSISTRLRSDFLSIDLAIEPQTRLRIASAETGARGVRIDVIGGKATAMISVGNTLDLQCDGCVARADGSRSTVALTDTLRLEMARRRIAAEPSGGVFAIAVEPGAGGGKDAAVLAATGLEAGRFEFHRRQDDRSESTLVEDGKITFIGSKAAPETIRRGDFLRLECNGPAYVRSLQAGSRVKLELDCNASMLRTGTEHGASSRLPSYLRWWYANETIALLVGALTSLAAAILAVLKWFGFSPKV